MGVDRASKGNGYTIQHPILPYSSCPAYYLLPLAAPQVCTNNCINDPVNPAVGIVYRVDEDVALGSDPNRLVFRRFYNSADLSGIDHAPGWRHSFDASIVTLYAPPPTPYPSSGVVSQQYATPSAACLQGFSDIRSAVSRWAGATVNFNGGSCFVTTPDGITASLPVYSTAIPASTPPTLSETT